MSSEVAKQGIVSILGSKCDQVTKLASLRRTLSADMSSKQWLAQNGLSCSPMNRIASSEELASKYNESSLFSNEENEKLEQDYVWGLIQSQKKEVEMPGQVDIWASIVSKTANGEEKSTLPPYIHPLVKSSTSALSEKSLDICTESLGSETGSEGFTSYAPSEISYGEEDKDQIQVTQSQPQQKKEWQPFGLHTPHFAKYKFSTTKKSPPKSFPPPLPYLAQRDRPSLHMQPRREDGRLVLEAVSIPSQNCLQAHRQDGRLLLTLANNNPSQELDLEEVVNQEDEIDEVNDEVFNYFEGEENKYTTQKEEETNEEEEEDENEDGVIERFEILNGAKELEIVMDQASSYSSAMIDVHRSDLVMKTLIGMNNRDPIYPGKLKKMVNLMETEMEANVNSTMPPSQSLPQSPMVARLLQSPPVAVSAVSFNYCDYFWRSKPAMGSPLDPIVQQSSCLKIATYNAISPKENREVVLLRGNKGDYLVPIVKGCREDKKRSLIMWESYCIATS